MGNKTSKAKIQGDKWFTVLYINVLHTSHPLALQGSAEYAKELAKSFFAKHTDIDPAKVDWHEKKFRYLNSDSRLEIAFVGKPHKSFQAPAYKIYKYEKTDALHVLFECEVRLVRRFIGPGFDYEALEIERTDNISDYAGSRYPEKIDIRISRNYTSATINKK